MYICQKSIIACYAHPFLLPAIRCKVPRDPPWGIIVFYHFRELTRMAASYSQVCFKSRCFYRLDYWKSDQDLHGSWCSCSPSYYHRGMLKRRQLIYRLDLCLRFSLFALLHFGFIIACTSSLKPMIAALRL